MLGGLSEDEVLNKMEKGVRKTRVLEKILEVDLELINAWQSKSPFNLLSYKLGIFRVSVEETMTLWLSMPTHTPILS
jgi:hypothetical protein